VYRYEDIKIIHLEVTEKCQSGCSMCSRYMPDGTVNPMLNMSELSLSDCKTILPPEFIKQLHHIYACGSYGDAIIAKDTFDIFKYFRESNPNLKLTLHTNGGARSAEWWEELALVIRNRGAVVFAVDGLEDTNHIYRKNVVWDNIIRAMESYTGAGGKAEWHYLVFRHNEHQVEEAEALAKSMGMKFVVKKSNRFLSSNAVLETSMGVSMPKNKKYINEELMTDLSGLMDRSSEAYNLTPIDCKVQPHGSIYLSARGLLLPCCWIASRMYSHNIIRDYKVKEIWDMIGDVDSIDAKKHGIKAVLDRSFIKDMPGKWAKPSHVEGKPAVCIERCGVGGKLSSSQY
jgi:MoaA/NifB/PqqE/SkfB family radical SAM enzyme